MKSISLISGKGGTGKSTVAGNLAYALADGGSKVLLFDADFGLSNLELMVGVDLPVTLTHIVRDNRPLGDAVYVTPFGFDLIGGGTGSSVVLGLNPNQIESLLGQLIEIASRYDYLLIDCGPGLGISVKSCFERSDSVVLVTTPEVTALTDAYAVMRWVEDQEPGKEVCLVINKAANQAHGERVSKSLVAVFGQFLSRGVRFLGSVRFDKSVEIAMNSGRLVLDAQPRSGASQDLYDVCYTLEGGGESGDHEEVSFLDKIKARFGKNGSESEEEAA